MHDFDEGIVEQIVFAILKILKISTDSVENIVKKKFFKNDKVKICGFSGSTKSKGKKFKLKGTAASVIFLKSIYSTH